MLRALMKPAGISWKSFTVTFVLALIFYALAWTWLSGRQTGRGPWVVEFGTNAAGVPQLVLAQNSLGISNLTVRFAGESLGTNRPGTVSFTKPQQRTPFGRVAYDDLMFQPGAVALDCFGHVVELLPRQLGLNGQPLNWSNHVEFVLWPTNKISDEARKKLKGGYRTGAGAR